MTSFFSILAERDAAIQDRNVAVAERKAALAARDVAILQRDAALVERDSAIMERDNALAALRYQDSMINSEDPSHGPDSLPHIHEHMQHLTHLDDGGCNPNELPVPDPMQMIPSVASEAEPGKDKKVKQTRNCKRRARSKDLSKQVTVASSSGWQNLPDSSTNSDDPSGEAGVSRPEWKDYLGLNLVDFDEATIAVPICSCTGEPQQCYKWGNGGWQSACCTTTLSMYPLPQMPNRRHTRISGRKMSGTAFAKLLSRLAGEGCDLSTPLDLKDHWAKHGTNRYSTIR